ASISEAGGRSLEIARELLDFPRKRAHLLRAPTGRADSRPPARARRRAPRPGSVRQGRRDRALDARRSPPVTPARPAAAGRQWEGLPAGRTTGYLTPRHAGAGRASRARRRGPV